jgi:hypothetical protein
VTGRTVERKEIEENWIKKDAELSLRNREIPAIKDDFWKL